MEYQSTEPNNCKERCPPAGQSTLKPGCPHLPNYQFKRLGHQYCLTSSFRISYLPHSAQYQDPTRRSRRPGTIWSPLEESCPRKRRQKKTAAKTRTAATLRRQNSLWWHCACDRKSCGPKSHVRESWGARPVPWPMGRGKGGRFPHHLPRGSSKWPAGSTAWRDMSANQ